MSAPSQHWNLQSPLCASRSRREVEFFVRFFRYRARLTRPRPAEGGLPDGLLEGSCARAKRRTTSNGGGVDPLGCF